MFLAWQTFNDYNQTGLDGLFSYPAQAVDIFTPLVLFALFSIVMLATFFSQKRVTGKGSFLSSFAAAGYFTAIIAIIMSLVENMIDTLTLTVTIVIAIIATVLLLISKE